MPRKAQYKAVGASEDDAEAPALHYAPRPSIWRVIIVVELVNVALLIAGYIFWGLFRPVPVLSELPVSYNTTRTFTVNKQDLSLAHNTPEANDYWKQITQGTNNGLVSLPLSWAEQHGLEPSLQPTAPGETVFQVDTFHQLHCLGRIRENILSAPYLMQLNPDLSEYDAYSLHTLHCVDYLRQAVQCASDVTLVSTGEDLEFDHSPPRQCRDFGSVGDWVMAHKWDYDRWTRGGTA